MNLPKIAMGAWAWGDTDGYFGNTMTAEIVLNADEVTALEAAADKAEIESIQFWESKME